MRPPKAGLHALRALMLPLCAVGLAGSVAAVSSTSAPSEIILAEGQTASDYFSTPGRVDSQGRKVFGDFKVESVDASYVGKARTRLISTVWFRNRERTVSTIRPLWLAPSRIIALADVGYAPRLIVRAPSGRTLSDETSPLGLSGREYEDFIDVPAAKMRVVLTVFPDHAVVDGKDSSKSLNPKNPRVRLTIFERVNGVPQQRVLVRKTVAVGETVSIPDGTTVVVREIRRAGRFRALDSRAIPLVPAFTLLSLLAAVDLVVRKRVRP